ncbi:MAG: maleylpyruvate isomerase family mycothiol-dependent enzyme [Anaerolineaceae bacterium]|nr:maleylpyruvate isomerase family mycothiol-dependent enzyme [Anaerolineaceae bacterium]
MRYPEPIIVVELFPEILERLLELLGGLSAAEWEKPTACAGWSIKDVALHLLGDDIGILSRKRDGYSQSADVGDLKDLISLIKEWNETWVDATRRMSTRMLVDLLKFSGGQANEYFQTLDPYALGSPVSWAGPDPAPVWLDLAREYTERWMHQQHIRDAVEKPGLREPRYFAPLLDAFIRALPYTYRAVEAAEGTRVGLKITGESGGLWTLSRKGRLWVLYVGISQEPDAEVIMEEDTAWRIFTKGLSREDASDRVEVTGEQSLGLKVLDMVSIIA